MKNKKDSLEIERSARWEHLPKDSRFTTQVIKNKKKEKKEKQLDKEIYTDF